MSVQSTAKEELLDAVTDAHRQFMVADNTWQSALNVVYGNDAGDARYDERGIATAELTALRQEVIRTRNVHHQAYQAFIKACESGV